MNTMWCFGVICICLITMSWGGLSPIYSPSYAHVFYQGAAKTELNSPDTKEEVTEPPQPTTDDGIIIKNCHEINPTITSDTTTEIYSETVNVTKVHEKQGPKKLHEAIELSEEFDPTQQPDLEPTYSPELQEQGIYYIYHPSGLLQRVVFRTRNDLQNMEYVANFNYQDVEPIVDPIYAYDPNTLLLERLQLL